jgi:hypothetical protein
MPKEKSPHAAAAATIRKQLKQLYPTTKFRVTSSVYSGGDSVYVRWVDGPTYDAVNVIVKDYQGGSFNSMEDIYEDDRNPNIPQVKYVLPQREMSDAVRAVIKADLSKKFGVDMDDERAVKEKLCRWPSDAISHEFSKNAY